MGSAKVLTTILAFMLFRQPKVWCSSSRSISPPPRDAAGSENAVSFWDKKLANTRSLRASSLSSLLESNPPLKEAQSPARMPVHHTPGKRAAPTQDLPSWTNDLNLPAPQCPIQRRSSETPERSQQRHNGGFHQRGGRERGRVWTRRGDARQEPGQKSRRWDDSGARFEPIPRTWDRTVATLNDQSEPVEQHEGPKRLVVAAKEMVQALNTTMLQKQKAKSLEKKERRRYEDMMASLQIGITSVSQLLLTNSTALNPEVLQGLQSLVDDPMYLSRAGMGDPDLPAKLLAKKIREGLSRQRIDPLDPFAPTRKWLNVSELNPHRWTAVEKIVLARAAHGLLKLLLGATVQVRTMQPEGWKKQERIGSFLPRQGWREELGVPLALKDAKTDGGWGVLDDDKTADAGYEEEEEEEEEEGKKEGEEEEEDAWVGDTPWHCRVCDVAVTNDIAWLDHINGKKHLKLLGFSTREKKVTEEEQLGALEQALSELQSARENKARKEQRRRDGEEVSSSEVDKVPPGWEDSGVGFGVGEWNPKTGKRNGFFERRDDDNNFE